VSTCPAIEGCCAHCGATMFYYPDDRRVAHRIPECPAYRKEMEPRTRSVTTVAVDEGGDIVAFELFKL